MNGTRAFVLRRVERREADWLVILYTEEFGLVRAVAPGIRKSGAKLRGHLEPLTKTEVMIVQGRNGYRLAGAVLIDSYPKLRASIDRRMILEGASSVVAKVFFEERDIRLWRALDELFAAFDSEGAISRTASAAGLYWFLTRMLSEMGYRASLDSLFRDTPRLKSLFETYESQPIAAALGQDISPAAGEAIGRALEKAFQVHTGHDFQFIHAPEDHGLARG